MESILNAEYQGNSPVSLMPTEVVYLRHSVLGYNCQESCISNQLILKHGVVYRDTPPVTVFGIEVFRVTVFGIGIPNTITAYSSINIYA